MQKITVSDEVTIRRLVIAEVLLTPQDRIRYIQEVRGMATPTDPGDTVHHRWTGDALMSVLNAYMLDDLVSKTRLTRERLTDILFLQAVPTEAEYDAIVDTFPEIVMGRDAPTGMR